MNQWNAMVDRVTDEMKVFTRPFVTPLVYEPPSDAPIFGSGTYVDMPPQDGSKKRLITCEHVIRNQPQQHRPHECAVLEPLVGTVCSDRHPMDAATLTVSNGVWSRHPHKAAPLSFAKFAPNHAPVEHEVMFFRGLAGENAYLGFGNLDAIVTGFCGQEKPASGDAQIFEIEWNPNGTTVSSGTSSDATKRVKFQNPAGFSGSLVWNTRFVETGCNLQTWTPDEAVVTGLLRRWDTRTATLLVWRVEHLRTWLSSLPSWA